jgi:uncharacterized repeat protein (TIGR03943 family)
MNRRTQIVVMFLVGVSLARVSLSGVYLRYVKAGLHPYLILAAIALIVASFAAGWYELRSAYVARARKRAGSPESTDAHATDHEPHEHRESRVSWLMVLPIVALTLVVPPALGSYAADRTGTALAPRFGIPLIPAGNPATLTVVDYATVAVYDHGHAIAGREVSLTGFITVGRSGEPVLTRLILNCCAADAQPIKIGLSGRVPAGLTPDEWLRVTGTYDPRVTRDPVNGGPIPYLVVSSTQPVATPRDPYEG